MSILSLDQHRDPPPIFRRVAPGNLFVRSILANARAGVDRGAASPADYAARLWPGDEEIAFVLRAASAPAQVGLAGWAAELGMKIVADALEVLYPVSAAAALLKACPSLVFGREASIGVPGFATSATGKVSAFVAERQPIPVFQVPVVGATLLPYKIAGIMVATREMIESSNAEVFITDLLRQALGRAFDEVLFDANAASPARPAGLASGVAALPPTAATTDIWGMSLGDVGILSDAVGAVAGNSAIAFVGSPGRRRKLDTLLGRDFSMAPLFASSAAGQNLYCVATAALISAVGVPEVEVSRVAALTLDNAPAADPTGPAGKSLFQTDTIGIKIRWPVAWALRDPRGFAWTTPTSW